VIKIKPLFSIHRAAVGKDRWSIGANVAYENYNNQYKELYLVVNFLYWSLSIGVTVDNKTGNNL